MRNTILSFLLYAMFSVTAFAAGTHSGGHGGDGHGKGGHAQGGHEFSVGRPAPGKPDRVIGVSMVDTMRFVFRPELGNIRQGEVIRFDVRNDGAILHEFSIGNAADQVRHAKMMREMPGMKHEDPNTVSLDPGESASITWQFEGVDTVVFACNIPGHFQAGMHKSMEMEGVDHHLVDSEHLEVDG